MCMPIDHDVVFATGQNFPHPFNPETWIPYALAKVSDVAISIYDIRGGLVHTLDLGLRQGLKAYLPEMAVIRNSMGDFEKLHRYK